jgi:hypothetical protein
VLCTDLDVVRCLSRRRERGCAQGDQLFESRFRVAGPQGQVDARSQPGQGGAVVAQVAVLDPGLDVHPDVVAEPGPGPLPQAAGGRLVSGSHQPLRQLAQHLRALALTTTSGLEDYSDGVVDAS